MMSLFSGLSDLIKIPLALLAGMAISALVLVLFYEGISLPLIGHVIDGRVESQRKAAIADMVSTADLAAAKAQTEKLMADLARAESLRKMAERNVESLMQQDQKDAQALAADQAADDGADGARYTATDIERMSARRRRAR
ncbi:hypothetical protein NAC44_11880 [Allorhizobium sp. BGMRC 0089]|uniref:hypothetical protein n=1 Tax=Allorhizobium sonneratiae TaxID=2934936 RepID=UPI002033F285|nr:hypothetical protein [Allorhizobium sonneratiae]MCM2293021.1 hypothetical protein [Allorhizobium sonneratiae]